MIVSLSAVEWRGNDQFYSSKQNLPIQLLGFGRIMKEENGKRFKNILRVYLWVQCSGLVIAFIIGGIMAAGIFSENKNGSTSIASVIGNFFAGGFAAAMVTLLITAIPVLIFAAILTLSRRLPFESTMPGWQRSKPFVYCIALSLTFGICFIAAIVFSIDTWPQIRFELLLGNFVTFASLAILPAIIGVNVFLRKDNTGKAQPPAGDAETSAPEE